LSWKKWVPSAWWKRSFQRKYLDPVNLNNLSKLIRRLGLQDYNREVVNYDRDNAAALLAFMILMLLFLNLIE